MGRTVGGAQGVEHGVGAEVFEDQTGVCLGDAFGDKGPTGIDDQRETGGEIAGGAMGKDAKLVGVELVAIDHRQPAVIGVLDAAFELGEGRARMILDRAVFKAVGVGFEDVIVAR